MAEVSLQALPPWAQEVREKEAIEKNPEVQGYLEKLNARITDVFQISRFDGGVDYIVKTDAGQSLDVKVVYIPRSDKVCGPTNFRIEFAPPSQS